MKRILSLLFGTLMILLLLSSCNKEPYFTIEGETDINFDIQGGYRSFKVSSNTDWFITSDESWFTVFPLKGTASKDPVTVSIACKENETLEKRSAIILITAGNIIEKVSVQQTEKSGIQVTSSKEYYISLKEQVLEIEVQSNEAYSVYSDCDWIDPYYDLKSATSDVLRVFVAENTSQYNRKGNIVIQSEHMEEVIAVTQAKMPVITTRETSLDLPYGGGSRTINVFSNVDFEVSSNVEWIHFVQKKFGEGNDYNYIIYMSFDENQTDKPREGNIEITYIKGEVKRVVPVNQDFFYIPNGAVDLGIVMTRTDGSQYHLLWRNRNLGSITPEDISDYFAWGETRSKSRYGWNTYAWQRSVGGYYKYVPYNRTDIWDAAGSPDDKTVLDLEDDAAHVQLGSNWRIPRVYEIRALLDQCEWTWTTTENGVNGYKVKGNNGNSIFLPASGYRVHEWDPSEVGNGGYYWSSDLYVEYPGSARSLNFTSDSHDIGSGGRPSGLTIRPVFE